MTSPNQDSSRPTASEYDQLRRDHNRVRREMMHWRLLAQLREERLLEIETNRLWRMLNFMLRVLADLKRHWKFLPLLALLSILALPFLPLLALILIPRSVRNKLLSVAAKIPRLNEALGIVGFKLRALWGFRQIRRADAEPLIYRRSERSYPSPKDPGNADLHHLLHQLSPQNRQVIQRFRLTPGSLLETTEVPNYQSLSQSEASLFKVCAAVAADTQERKR